MTIRSESILDNIKAKLTWIKELVQAYLTANTKKIIAILLALFAVLAIGHHLGTKHTLQRLAMQEPVVCPVADPVQVPVEDPELKEKLSKSEQEKARLQRKVSDYEKQLAKHRGKGGSFILSPADARGLSNIR
ncbi:hypothetical protein [Bradyrhizobium phage BDU-MI-1]|nr:hypothetical protein [Bradyrhizobium phage BDU-MI-1]